MEHVVNQVISTDKILSVGKQIFNKIMLRVHIQHVMKFNSCSVFCKMEQELTTLLTAIFQGYFAFFRSTKRLKIIFARYKPQTQR
jgi:hypothetical protein